MAQGPAKQSYSRGEVRRILGIRENRLKSWEAQGWVAALEVYGFHDLLVLRTLQGLRQSRVRAERIGQALAALWDKLRRTGNPLRELKLVCEGRKIVVLIDGQKMEPVSGQLLLDFDAAELNRLLAFPQEQRSRGAAGRDSEAEYWFRNGLELERTGAPFEDIIQAYQRAVDLDPASAGALVNLGTVHFDRRDWDQAERCYGRALEVEPRFALAHFNLGNLYDERNDAERAQAHYEKALELTPDYADAHYNLALLCQRHGLLWKAVRHWKAYLALDSASSWAVIARRELDKLRDAALVGGRGR